MASENQFSPGWQTWPESKRYLLLFSFLLRFLALIGLQTPNYPTAVLLVLITDGIALFLRTPWITIFRSTIEISSLYNLVHTIAIGPTINAERI